MLVKLFISIVLNASDLNNGGFCELGGKLVLSEMIFESFKEM